MKKLFALLAVSSMFLVPIAASAASVADMQTQLRYVLARASALATDEPVRCFLVAGKTQVRVGEPFTLVWFSTGANHQSPHNGVTMQPYGVQTIALSTVGKWVYTLKFYDAGGIEVPCSVTLIVTP